MNDLQHNILNLGYQEVEEAPADVKATFHKYASKAAWRNLRMAHDLFILCQEYDTAAQLLGMERKADPDINRAQHQGQQEVGVPGAEPPAGLSAVSPRGGEDAASIPHADPGGANHDVPEP
jgi:hypothetical protein